MGDNKHRVRFKQDRVLDGASGSSRKKILVLVAWVVCNVFFQEGLRSKGNAQDDGVLASLGVWVRKLGEFWVHLELEYNQVKSDRYHDRVVSYEGYVKGMINIQNI